jgi:hypothetical protein
MVWKSVAPAATRHFLLFCALMDQVPTNQWRVLPGLLFSSECRALQDS